MAETSGSFIKKFVGFSLVTWVSFGLSFLTAPISTRLFIPEVLGKINIFNTYANLFGVLVLLGLDQSFVRFYHERPNNRSLGYMFSFCYGVTYAFFSGIIILSLPFSKFLSWELFEESDNAMLYMFFISIFCSATLRYLNLSYRMEQNIKMFTIQGILITLVSKVLYLGVGFWNPTYKPALLVLTVSNMVLAISFLFIQHNRFERLKEYDKVFSNEIFKFALPLIPVSVLMWANSSIPQIVIQKTMDYHSVGVFSSAVALASIILVVQAGFNTFWAPYTLTNYKTQTGQFYKVHRYLITVLVITSLLLVLLQDIVFLILGEQYRAAKNFFPFLILGPVCYIIGETTGIGIGISKKTYWNLIISIASVFVNIILCVILVNPIGIPGVAMATSFAGITAMLLKTYVGERYYPAINSTRHMYYCILFLLSSSFVTLYVKVYMIKMTLLMAILLFTGFIYRKDLTELKNILYSFFK